jgi:hypothetical protein
MYYYFITTHHFWCFQILVKFMEDEFLTEYGFMNKSIAYCHFTRLENLLSEYNYKMFLSLFSKSLVKYFEQTIKTAKWVRKFKLFILMCHRSHF